MARKSLDELICHYEARERECRREIDELVNRWNNTARRAASTWTEDDLKRACAVWEDERQMARDTIAWLKTIKALPKRIEPPAQDQRQ